MKRKTTEQFIEQAVSVHGNTYDYSFVRYKNTNTDVEIVCCQHGSFHQKPMYHLNGSRCPKCGIKNASNIKRKTTEQFIEQAVSVHGNTYDYSQTEYINPHTKIKIKCNIHGTFNQRASSHLSGSGCPKCGTENTTKQIKHCTDTFVRKAKKLHYNKYNYNNVEYIDTHTDISITCKKHGDFIQTPMSHLRGAGCPKCLGRNKTTNEFIKELRAIHNNEYIYNKINYIDSSTKVTLICNKHGEFEQTPNSLLNKKTKCPQCAKNNYSKKAIMWLTEIAEKENIVIQHAENNGEYNIPGTNYKADGYCKETNTIYEFYGDAFHGNLTKFNKNDLCHPYDKNITAQQLYEYTLQREQVIKQLGYNLISIWESEYNC